MINSNKTKTDLNRIHSECEQNYRRINRLGFDSRKIDNEQVFSIAEKENLEMHLKVLRVSRYTSVILLNFSQTDIEWLPKIELQMRYYEDARMLEVIEWCSDRTIPWELSEKKHNQSRDEKWQWNAFLGELLLKATLCRELQTGA